MPYGNCAYALDIVSEIRGDEDCLIQGGRRISWRNAQRRAGNLASWMQQRGVSPQGKVSLYTYNHPAYMEGLYAAFKSALVPVNVNYRYRAEEIGYLLENSDTEIVVVHEDFASLLAEVLPRLPKVVGVLVVKERGCFDMASISCAADYETVAETDREPVEVEHSLDDLLLLYTGGTTGMPKGVMWRQEDMFGFFLTRIGGPSVTEAVYREALQAPARTRTLVCPPLMHGTGWISSMVTWFGGGAIVMMGGTKKFDPAELWRTVAAEKITSITIVGDSFAKPMLRELQRDKSEYDLSSLEIIGSSGVMWSEETKQGLLSYNKGMMLIDSFSSSEALGMGMSITTAEGSVQTGKFQLSKTTRLFSDRLELLDSKPGVKGLVGVSGSQPVGYYKDPDKSARTFVECEAGRFSIPGDWAVVNDDGVTLSLLGRGSVCINTGGEKVFPEEVEEVIKRFEGVADAVCVGVPDERWGEAITAVVSRHADEQGIDLDVAALIAHVKEHLAGYKAPKHVVQVEKVYRSPSGKADFRRTRQTAMEHLGIH